MNDSSSNQTNGSTMHVIDSSPNKRSKDDDVTLNIQQETGISKQSQNDLPDEHKGRMIVVMEPNRLVVPYYCFKLKYRFPRVADEPLLKKNRIEGTTQAPVVVYAEREPTEDDPPPPLSNKVLSAILDNITRAYKNFKVSLQRANGWLDDHNFVQDDFFVHTLSAAAKWVHKSRLENIAMFTPENIMLYSSGNVEDKHIAEMIRRINKYRVIGFTANVDNHRERVEILLYHNTRTEDYMSGNEVNFFCYGLPEESYDYTVHY